MKKRKIWIILIIALVILIGSTFLKLYYDVTYKKYYFNPIKIENLKTNLKNDDKLDEITYKDNIITKDLTSINYEFYDDKNSIIGKIYIEDGYLFISNINSNYIRKISNIKLKTMYKKNFNYLNGIYIYAISENNELYEFSLTSNNIKTANIYKIYTKYKVKNFVNINFSIDAFDQFNTLFVLSDDGNIYDVISNIRYNKNIKALFNKFYVFEDNTITNIYGKQLKDKNGKAYIIKYAFRTGENNDFSGSHTILIITEDNKLIYINDDNNLVYEFQEKVRNINFNVKVPYVKSKLEIEFEDDSTVGLEAECNQYFCNCKI